MDTFDCTTLVRKVLPLPTVHVDTGPCTEYVLDSIFRKYLWRMEDALAGEGPPLQAFQYDAFLLAAWATRGWVPGEEL
jgi:hypothetical protein